LGQAAEIFVPTISNPTKRQRLAEYGAEVRVVGDLFVESLAASEARVKETGALGVHAFDHEDAIFGQGTIAREIEEQIGVPDVILVSVGGGGFAAGVASWFQQRSRIIGIEPECAPTLHSALKAGSPVDVSTGGVAADALGCRRIGDVTFPILQQYIAGAVLVDDDSIMGARKMLWSELRLLVEPAAALPIAALKAGKVNVGSVDHVCIIVCGANTELRVE
jgi:threonine dehydratase